MLNRILLATFTVACLAMANAPASATPPGPLPGFEVIDDRDADDSAQGAQARYHGQTINLGDGWDGASVCAVVAAGDVRCYDSEEEFRGDVGGIGSADVTVQSMSDCLFGWACIWEFVDFGGRKLQFHDPGADQGLAQYDFRDKTSAVFNNMPSGYYFRIIDYRTGWSDPYLVYVWGSYSDDLRDEPYPGGVYGGGNWNNRADAIRVVRV